MPSSWLVIDSDFPTFSKETPVKQQVSELQEYMVVLIEQLRYQLTNLNTANWNDAAMKQFQEDTTRDLTDELTKTAKQLTETVSALEALTGRVGELEDRADRAETEIAYLQQEQETQNQELERLDELLTDAENGLDELGQMQKNLEDSLETLREAVEALAGAVGSSDEEITVGDGIRPIHLSGVVYINGVKLELEGSNETA